MLERYNFSSDFQDLILACVCRFPERFVGVDTILQSRYFTGVNSGTVAELALEYYKTHSTFPTFTALGQLAARKTKKTFEDDVGVDINEYVRKLSELDCRDVEYVREQVVKFSVERALLLAATEVARVVQEGKEPNYNIVEKFQQALSLGSNLQNFGMDAKENAYDVLSNLLTTEAGINCGFDMFDNYAWKRGMRKGWLIVPLAPPKAFKCWGKGTGIMMFDGSVKKVEDIKVGDLVMGDDSTPRKVLTCGKGYGPLYSVKQKVGNDFVCNDAHILCLKSPTGEIKEIEAKDYVDKKPFFKRTWQGYKSAVEYPEHPIPLDPYLLGLWLGDGTTSKPQICVSYKDTEISDYINSYAKAEGLRVSVIPGSGCCMMSFVKTPLHEPACQIPGCGLKHRSGGLCQKHYSIYRYHGYKVTPPNHNHVKNPVVDALRSLSIYDNKKIPSSYIFNSQHVRLKLLAGIIDSDGHYCKRNGFIVNTTSKQFADDIVYLAKSLGFMVRCKDYATAIKSIGFKGTSWHVTITGNLSRIPTLLRRKQASDSHKHRLGRYRIEVTPIGNGDYYGFTLDNNKRLLLEDFTVSHNTTLCVNMARHIAGPNIGENVVYYACEIDETLALQRLYQAITQKTEDDFYENPKKFYEELTAGLDAKLKAHLFMKHFPAKTATINDIRAHLKTLIAVKGWTPRVIFIDYAETIKPSDSEQSEHRINSSIYTEARALGKEFGCTVIMPDRCNRDTVEQAVPTSTSFQGAIEKGGIVDVAFGLCGTPKELADGIIRFFFFLNRHGPQFLHFRGRVDPERMTVTINEKLEWNELEALEQNGRVRRGGRGGAGRNRAVGPRRQHNVDAMQEE